MSGPGFSRNNRPAARADGKPASPQKLRVLSQDGSAKAVPNVAMPRANTELTDMLADDAMLCLRRRVTSATPLRDPPAVSPPVGDEGLARVIDAWPGLPDNLRAAVLAVIGRE